MKRLLFVVAFLFLLACTILDHFYYRPRMGIVQEKIYIFNPGDSKEFTRWKQIVEILTSDLYKQGIISWNADSLLKELDRARMEGR